MGKVLKSDVLCKVIERVGLICPCALMKYAAIIPKGRLTSIIYFQLRKVMIAPPKVGPKEKLTPNTADHIRNALSRCDEELIGNKSFNIEIGRASCRERVWISVVAG